MKSNVCSLLSQNILCQIFVLFFVCNIFFFFKDDDILSFVSHRVRCDMFLHVFVTLIISSVELAKKKKSVLFMPVCLIVWTIVKHFIFRKTTKVTKKQCSLVEHSSIKCILWKKIMFLFCIV